MAIAGILLGLVGGPLLLYAVGLLVLKFREGKQIQQIQKMKQEHNDYIKSLRKEHEKYRKQFNRKLIKIEKIIDKSQAEARE